MCSTYSAEKDRIARDNMKLAQEIFKIMAAPGLVSEILVKTYNNHPGTNNFGVRLNEAKRIHYENKFIAERLENVRPYYQFSTVVGPNKKSRKVRLKKQHSPVTKNTRLKHDFESSQGSSQSPRSPDRVRTAPMMKRRTDYDHLRAESASESAAVGGVSTPATSPRPPSDKNGGMRPKNLILEHWKIQNGRVLDLAVLKEPFEDRFSILGIDVDNGQRYQLSLSSEEVTNALEGDMVITTFENPNVWMALIEKVNLRPVVAFIKPGVPSAKPGSAPVEGSKRIQLKTDDRKADAAAPQQPDFAQTGTSTDGAGGSLGDSMISSLTGNAHLESSGAQSDHGVDGSEEPAVIPLGDPEVNLTRPIFSLRDADGSARGKSNGQVFVSEENTVLDGEWASLVNEAPAIEVVTGDLDGEAGIYIQPTEDMAHFPPLSRPDSFTTDISISRPNSRAAGYEHAGGREMARPRSHNDQITSKLPLTPSKSAADARAAKAGGPAPPEQPKNSTGGRGRKQTQVKATVQNTEKADIAKEVAKSKLSGADRPTWNSNALVTKVREKMIEEQKKESNAKSAASEAAPAEASKKQSSTPYKDAPKVVQISPSPPVVPKPTGPAGKDGHSVRGRKGTQFVRKAEVPPEDEEDEEPPTAGTNNNKIAESVEGSST
jgi:hypothetical protein